MIFMSIGIIILSFSKKAEILEINQFTMPKPINQSGRLPER